MTETNKQIRSDIMEILDGVSKDISEGVYLELCNKLMKFKFEEEIDEYRTTRIVSLTEETAQLAAEIEARIARPSRYVLNPKTGRRVLRRGRIGRRLARQE